MPLETSSEYYETTQKFSQMQLKKRFMKAFVWKDSRTVACEMREIPEIIDPSDVIVQVTYCSVSSGGDPTIYSGKVSSVKNGMTLGHEACGIIVQAGPGVRNVLEGDHVIISPLAVCGTCEYCIKEEYSACSSCNHSQSFEEMYGGPPSAGIFGSSEIYGGLPGCQAEYVRVPYADVNCYKIPSAVPEDYALLIGDVLAPALHATEMAAVKRGDNVVILGLGPVGLYAAAWCRLKGANKVFGIDNVRERLELAHRKLRIDVFDRHEYSSDELLRRLRGTVPIGGVDAVIDATSTYDTTGWQQRMQRTVGFVQDKNDPFKEIFQLIRKFGHVSIISQYIGEVQHFPIGHLFQKNLFVRSGQCPVPKYFEQIMTALINREIDPSWIVSHRIRFDQIPEAYEKLFYKHEGIMKVIIEVTSDAERKSDSSPEHIEADELRPMSPRP